MAESAINLARFLLDDFPFLNLKPVFLFRQLDQFQLLYFI